MFEYIFIILFIIYISVSIRIDEWITISELGFKSDTPIGFMRNPRIYHNGRFAIFLGAVAVSLCMKPTPWYVGIGSLAVAWLGAGWVGRKRAYGQYRKNFNELIALEDNTPEEIARYSNESKRTDDELASIIAGNFQSSTPTHDTQRPILSIEEVFELDDNGVREYTSTLSEEELENFEQKLIESGDDDNLDRYYELLPEDRLNEFEKKFPDWPSEPDVNLEKLEVDWDFKSPHHGRVPNQPSTQALMGAPEDMLDHLNFAACFIGNVECLQCGYQGGVNIQPPELICPECGSNQWKPMLSLTP